MENWPVDGDLQAFRVIPARPRAVVLLVHGLGEHAGRHQVLARALAARDIAVYAYDQRGHGRSPGRRAFIERFADLVDESLAMRRRVSDAHPGLPLVLIGASMGGVVAVRSAQRDAAGLAGVVLVAPALAPAGNSPIRSAAARAIAAVAPAAPLIRLDVSALSREPAVHTAFVADPLVLEGGIPVRTALELVAAAADALREAPAWDVPALIVHGDADRIALANGSRQFAGAAQTASVSLRLVPGGYHEPLNDPGGEALIAEIGDWILARTFVPVTERPAPSQPIAGEPGRPVFTWWQGLAFGAGVNVLARLLGTNTGRYEEIVRPWFAPPGWVFPLAWGVNSALSIAGNVRVLNAPRSTDRTAYLRLWAATWMLYVSFGYAFFRRRSPLLGLLVTTNFLTLAVLSFGRVRRIDRRLGWTYVTLLPWLCLATAVAASVALDNPDPLLDPPGQESKPNAGPA